MSLPALSPDSAVPQRFSAADEPGRAFYELGLGDELVDALVSLGYREPTEIQSAAIPALLIGQDVTGVAQTGTGKTAAFGLPLLTSIDPAVPGVQALVLVPTRELAVQVAGAVEQFAARMRGVAVTAIYGGAPIGRQITALRRGSSIVVGTPGRVIDLMKRRALDLSTVRFAVLDEADEMLRMGFVDDVDRILGATPSARQTALFSATMPRAIRQVALRHLRAPVDVSVAASATPVSGIEQGYAVLRFADKSRALQRLLATSDAAATVVFVRTRSSCDELGTELLAAGVRAAVISGDVTQSERERTIERLRHGRIDVLVATDVAARGMDVERIGLVVNFDAAIDPETYVHRVGRTGRAGRSGRAITFFTPKELSKRRAVERAIGRRLDEITIPTAAEVRQHRAGAALAAAVERQTAGRLGAYRTLLLAEADRTGLRVEDIAASLIATMIDDDGTEEADVIELAPRRNRETTAARPHRAGQGKAGHGKPGNHRSGHPGHSKSGRGTSGRGTSGHGTTGHGKPRRSRDGQPPSGKGRSARAGGPDRRGADRRAADRKGATIGRGPIRAARGGRRKQPAN